MRVTDEMVAAVVRRVGYLGITEGDAQQALEAALADVPEPNSDPPPAPGESWAGTAGRLGAELMLAQERIAELEAERANWQPMTAVEKVMRKHDVADIHFWQEGRSYDGYTGEGYDVSITLRSGRGVYYAMTLADAAAKLPDEVPQ